MNVPNTNATVTFDAGTLSQSDGTVKTVPMTTPPAGMRMWPSPELPGITLFNAANGRLIGTMTNTALSGGGAKYSFQGTVSPVMTVLLTSSFYGTASGAAAQR